MRKASRLLFEDFERCQNHRLKKVYEMGEKGSGQYLRDFECVAQLCQYIAQNGNVSDVLRVFQHTHELSLLVVVIYNATRWEGRFLTVKRFYEIRESLLSLEQLSLVSTLREKVPDFLRGAFFDRLKSYLRFLAEMNDVSLLFQSQKFPTGCLVPLCVFHLQNLFQSVDFYNPKHLSDFKLSFLNAIKEVFVATILEKCNSFLKAALFHPGIARFLPHFVSQKVLEECWDAVKADIETLEKDTVFPLTGLERYRTWLAEEPAESMPPVVIAELKLSGSFAGCDPLVFWKEVAVGQTNAKKFGGSAYLLPVASMVLALPAGESVDEFTFSSTQRTLTAARSTLSPTHLEQITVVRMFIRNFGWSPQDVALWLGKAREEHDKEQSEKKKERTQMK